MPNPFLLIHVFISDMYSQRKSNKFLNALRLSIQSGMRKLVDSGRYDTHENFTVVLQPFFREIVIPRLEVKMDITECKGTLCGWNLDFPLICLHLTISTCFHFEGWTPRSLLLLPRLFSPEPESSYADGSCTLE